MNKEIEKPAINPADYWTGDENQVDVSRRPDGSLYLSIPRREGVEQYGITWNDLHRLHDSTSQILTAVQEEPALEPKEPTEVGE